MKLFRTLMASAAVLSTTAAVTLAAAPASAAPVTVARYTFDAGASATGLIAENSGRGVPLKVRRSGSVALRFGPRTPGRYVAFPARCAPPTAPTCGRLILEGADDPDLDPGTRPFRWGALINATAGQVGQSANVMQKGVSSTDSQWKLQIGGVRPRAQCVMIGTGSKTAYIARSEIAITDGRWHRVTCIRGTTVLGIVVDGVMRGTVRIPATLNIANAMPLRVGGPNLAASADLYNGAVDDVFAAVG
jgi:hypothetical protein